MTSSVNADPIELSLRWEAGPFERLTPLRFSGVARFAYEPDLLQVSSSPGSYFESRFVVPVSSFSQYPNPWDTTFDSSNVLAAMEFRNEELWNVSLGAGPMVNIDGTGPTTWIAQFVTSGKDSFQVNTGAFGSYNVGWPALRDATQNSPATVMLEVLEEGQAYSPLIADIDFDGQVGFKDFLRLSSAFGHEGSYRDGDIDGNAKVEFSDFLLLSETFGNQTSKRSSVANTPEPSISLPALVIFSAIVVLFQSRKERGTRHSRVRHAR